MSADYVSSLRISLLLLLCFSSSGATTDTVTFFNR